MFICIPYRTGVIGLKFAQLRVQCFNIGIGCANVSRNIIQLQADVVDQLLAQLQFMVQGTEFCEGHILAFFSFVQQCLCIPDLLKNGLTS
ncbi:hypothetical protein D9M68_966140 [compost metagenome]